MTRLPNVLRLSLAGLLPLVSTPGCKGGGTDEESTSEADAETGVHDPLSMPKEPTLDPDDFTSAEVCADCHPTHFAEWSLSRHANSMKDPVFRALVQLRQTELQGEEDQFCTQCHSAICTRGGECVSGFEFESLPAIALEGVTCEACHKVESIERTYNSGHVLDPEGPIRGPIADPVPSPFHESEYAEHYDQSEFCGGCHDVVETSGLNLERPFAEWLESPANPDQNCQSCHMPTYDGEAATGAGMRTGLHRHRWVGVDLPMEEGVDAATIAMIDADIEALLADAATIELGAPANVTAGQQLDVTITVANDIAGHAFPTGSTFIRQVWVELTATDVDTNIIYSTGTLDSEGDLGNVWSTVDPFSDPDLITLSSGLLDAYGEPELFSWRATEHGSNAISPLHERTFTLFVPVPSGTTPGPITLQATLHFRSHPPFLLRQLGLPEAIVQRAVVRDIASDTLQITVG